MQQQQVRPLIFLASWGLVRSCASLHLTCPSQRQGSHLNFLGGSLWPPTMWCPYARQRAYSKGIRRVIYFCASKCASTSCWRVPFLAAAAASAPQSSSSIFRTTTRREDLRICFGTSLIRAAPGGCITSKGTKAYHVLMFLSKKNAHACRRSRATRRML